MIPKPIAQSLSKGCSFLVAGARKSRASTRSARTVLGLAVLLVSASVAAQTIATSPAPDHVAVTVYRDPNRGPETAPNLAWLNGYALISETRTVQLPVGEAELRFEGVAGGIIPQSAIVTGLPQGVIERNRDAYLLSSATLLDRTLGQRVHLRRTSRATGTVRETDAIVRSGAQGAVVLQGPDGIEALRCTGLAETIVYDRVPAGLSARPTLSVRARSAQAGTAIVTLSYLATGFDWQANYVARLSPDGSHVALFAWLTLANGDETGFRDADTQAVAGQLNRLYVPRQASEGGPLALRCWPAGTTSDIPAEAEDIVVTGSRIGFAARAAGAPPPPPPPPPPLSLPLLEAQQEALGDLKLYRIPEPVSVAAHSQKQVALLHRDAVQVRIVYRRRIGPGDGSAPAPAERVIVTRNRDAEGLGLPLPSGRLLLFSEAGPRPILLGEGIVRDRAVGEEVEIGIGPATGVTSTLTVLDRRKTGAAYELMVANDRSEPVVFEAEFAVGALRFAPARRLGRRNAMPLWSVTVPANSRVSLRYALSR